MPLIEWDESFSVNNEEIDRQHQKWIAIMNDLDDSIMKNDNSENKYTTGDALEAMKEYVRDHFAYEEDYMQKINYPDFTRHRNIHTEFYVQIKNYHVDSKSGKVVLNTEIMKQLVNWLKHHILNEDKKYSTFTTRGR